LIINSPVGRFPFAVTSVRRQGRTLVLSGEMGNWPTSVEVVTSDVPAMVRLLRPLLFPAAGMIGLAGLAWLRGHVRH
jgi:hypothetical protein